MYDMYPEWGPAKHRPDAGEDPAGAQAATAVRALRPGLDLRDDGGQRPDDN